MWTESIGGFVFDTQIVYVFGVYQSRPTLLIFNLFLRRLFFEFP